MRMFIALELSDAVRQHLAGLSARAKGLLPGCSWVRPESLHVTMKFLGEVAEPKVGAVCAALNGVTAGGPILLRASHLECFPPRGRVRVVAAGLAGDVERLRTLHREIDRACADVGIPTEGRRFVPHVTLARARRGQPSRVREDLAEFAHDDLPGPDMVAHKFTLMESRLKPAGAEYLPLSRFAI